MFHLVSAFLVSFLGTRGLVCLVFGTRAAAEPSALGGSVHESYYDYIVVGAGVTGLVVANRLTEDPSVSVLILERGYFDDSPQAIVPYWANSLDASVLINPTSAPNLMLNNNTWSVAVPAVVGGGSVVNGMAYLRGSRQDYDAWAKLGNSGWGWNDMLQYFRKGTTFMEPSFASAKQWNMTWDPTAYGQGLLHITIPNFQYPDMASFWRALRSDTDIPKLLESNDGFGPGASFTLSTIDARDMTRATSRKEYYDPFQAGRRNLHLETGQVVTEILFDNLRASGVRMLSKDSNKSQAAYARREVILAAGAIQTPQLLQVSGIGPAAVLKSAGITVKKDLAAVGANLQDHATVLMLYGMSNASFPNPDTISINETYNATVWAEYWVNKSGPIAAASASTTYLLSLSQLLSASKARSIATQLATQNASRFLPDAYRNKLLIRGFEAQRSILANNFVSNNTSVVAHPILGNGLFPGPLLKPLSRGTVTLDPDNPHGLPVVQYNTLMNPIDAEIVVAIVKNARSFWQRPELAHLGPVELSPGAQYQNNDKILEALTTNGVLWPSLAHPCGTCAMMPEDLGGCVAPNLTVYGVTGLSVVDASILPIIPGAPLQATMYAVAEKAADLIKRRWRST